MAAQAVLSQPALRVEPGGTAELVVTVRNDSSVVDEFTLEVLGAPSDWSSVEPPTLALFPGEDGTARVAFSPARDRALAAGAQPFAVKVSSREDPLGSVVEEGTIDVGVFADNFAELVPRTARSRREARYDLALDNRGNRPMTAEFVMLDPDRRLRVRFAPHVLTVEPGAAAFSRVRVRPRKVFWRGADRTLPFGIQAHPDDGSQPLVADGTFVQQALLPTWAGKAALALLALAAILAALWFGLLRPAVKSEAKQAAKKQVAAAKQHAAAAQQAAQAAQSNTKQATKAAKQAQQKAAAATGKPGAAAALGGPLTSNTGGRIQLNVAPGKTSGRVLPGVPKDKTFELTDVVFENAYADAGVVRVLRGKVVVLEEGLENFRSLDQHFVSPLPFPAGAPPRFQVVCRNTNQQPCRAAVYLGGYLQ